MQDAKADVILKYTSDEARNLKAYGELPDNGKAFFLFVFFCHWFCVLSLLLNAFLHHVILGLLFIFLSTKFTDRTESCLINTLEWLLYVSVMCSTTIQS